MSNNPYDGGQQPGHWGQQPGQPPGQPAQQGYPHTPSHPSSAPSAPSYPSSAPSAPHPTSIPSANQPGYPQYPTSAPTAGQPYPGSPSTQSQTTQAFPTQAFPTQSIPTQPVPTQSFPTLPLPAQPYLTQPGSGQSGFGGTPKKSLPMIPIIAAVVGLLLIVGTVYLVSRGGNSTDPGTNTPPPTTGAPSGQSSAPPSSDPPSTDPPSTQPPSTASTGPSDSAKAPGPGTYTAVMAELKKRQFTCTEEAGQPFTSTMCTHYGKAPSMVVYVAAHPDGSLGRLALQIQSTSLASSSKALSDYLIGQFADADSVAKVKSTIAGSATEYVNGTTDRFSYRGRADGSIVMYAPDFALDGNRVTIEFTGEQMAAVMKAKGFTCAARSAGSDVVSCSKGTAPSRVEVVYYAPTPADKIIYTNLVVNGPDLASTKKAFDAELAAVYGTVPGGLKASIDAYIKAADPLSGATGYSGPHIFDYFPPAKFETAFQGSFYVRAPCWQNNTRNC